MLSGKVCAAVAYHAIRTEAAGGTHRDRTQTSARALRTTAHLLSPFGLGQSERADSELLLLCRDFAKYLGVLFGNLNQSFGRAAGCPAPLLPLLQRAR